MRQAQRQLIGETDPCVGREGERLADAVGRGVRFDRELGVHLTAREGQRPGDDVVRVGVRSAGEREKRGYCVMAHAATLACALLFGCRDEAADIDQIFYNGDGRKVHCALNMDDVAGVSVAEFEGALDRALERGETAEFYGHKPGVTVPVEKIEAIVAAASARGLPFVLYSDFAHGEGNGPGVALSLDDNSVALWDGIRPMLREYDAHLTFFVSRYTHLDDSAKATLRDFLTDGHELQPHSIEHLREPEYVEQRGLAALMNEEVLPSIDALRADGYPSEAFAYPFGARTSEIDEEILKHVKVLRSLSFPFGFPVEDACP